MAEGVPAGRRGSFVPRITVALVAGLVIFMLLALGYALPECLGEPPPGAIPDYCRERAMARLEGKILWMLLASYGVVAALAVRGILPGSARRS